MDCRHSDPAHPYYLTNCFVCNESGEKFIYGYGGKVCASCRAFFRRAHQKTRVPTFNCRAQSECSINVTNRRKCQKCRYDWCLKAGMKPEFVLTIEEKERRFRKMIKKKNNICKNEEKKQNIDDEDVLYESVITTYRHTVLTEKCDVPQLEFKNPKNRIFHFFEQMGQKFRKFASMQKEFSCLEESIKESLLMQNTPLFIQMISLQMLLNVQGNPTYQEILADDSNLQSIKINNLYDLNNLIGFLKDETKFSTFNNLQEKLTPLLTETQNPEAVLAFCILFNNQSLPIVATCEKLYDNYIHCHNLKMQDFLLTLNKMAEFYTVNSIPNENTTSSLNCSNLVMCYTTEEELWLQMRLKNVEDAMRSVTLGEQLIQEFMMFSLDVPPSKKFIADTTEVYLERMWRLFKLHPEFDELPFCSKNELVHKNGPAVFALLMARLENCTSGMDQLQESFGELDTKKWQDNYLRVFDRQEKVKKMSFKDSLKYFPNTFTKEELHNHRELMDSLYKFTNNPELYKLLLLHTATSSKLDKSLANQHVAYEQIVYRRYSSQGVAEVATDFVSCWTSLTKIFQLLYPYMSGTSN